MPAKSTTAPSLLRDALQVSEFLNADAIAGGLSAFRTDSVAIPTGRAMLERMRYLAKTQADFAFESHAKPEKPLKLAHPPDRFNRGEPSSAALHLLGRPGQWRTTQ